MKRKIRGMIAAVTAAALAATGFTGSGLAVSASDDAAMGRYMESEIPVTNMSINGGRVLEDGSIRLVGANEEGFGVWDSEDGGASWERTVNFDEIMQTENGYISAGTVSPDGSVFCCIYEQEDEKGFETGDDGVFKLTGTNRFVRILPDKTVKDIELDIPEDPYGTIISQMIYLRAGEILVRPVGVNQVFLLDDETGEQIRTYNTEDKQVAYFHAAGERLYLFGAEGLQAFDYESGEEASGDEALAEALETQKSYFEIFVGDGSWPLVMCSGAQEGELYYCTEEGIFRYQQDGSLVEQIAEGKLNSLSKPSISKFFMQVLDDGSVIVCVNDNGETKLLHYVYDPEVPAVPDTEIRIYSLYENSELQQAAAMFQTRNPNYYLNLETGVSGEDGVTAEDALRTLNTEIMGGNGPDVLILDGMPIDSYMEKGVLADISDVYQELLQDNGLYENIAGTYEKEGAVYAIPSRFAMPVLVGKEDVLKQITGVKELAETAQKLKSGDEKAKTIVDVFSIYWMLQTFYGAYSPALLTEEGDFDQTAAQEFMEQMKQIFDLNEYSDEVAEKRYMTENVEGSMYDGASYCDTMAWLTDEIKLQGFNVKSGYGFANLVSTCREKDLQYIVSPVSGKNVFIPSSIIGISGRSSQIGGAKEFLKFLLSEEAQAVNVGSGFPVNRKAFDQEVYVEEAKKVEEGADDSLGVTSTIIADENEIVKEVEFEIRVPDDEAIGQLKELVESLDTPACVDAVMEELFTEQAAKCIAGEISAEEAAGAVGQKMSLYLAE